MRIRSNVKLVDLIKSAKLCEEDVFFKTEDGNVLNMKSMLSTLLLQSIADDSLIAKGQIVCMNENDYKVLSDLIE